MNPTPKIFLMLLGATLVFHTTLKYMIDNIEEFETLPLPPKKIKKISTNNPTIQVNAKIKDSWKLVNFLSGETHTIKDNETKKAEGEREREGEGGRRRGRVQKEDEEEELGGVGVRSPRQQLIQQR